MGGLVSEHFGHCEGFMIYETDEKKIVSKNFVKNPGHQPGVLPVFVKEMGTKLIIVGGMGERAQILFGESNICVITGASGSCDEALENYLKGQLKSSNSICKEHSNAGDCGGH